MSKKYYVMSRKKAFRLAWSIFWMATGTRRVGLIIEDDGTVEIVGNDLIEEGKT